MPVIHKNCDEVLSVIKKINLPRFFGIIVAAVALLSTGLFIWLFGTIPSPYGRTESLVPVHITISGQHFAIPKAYIWDRSAWAGGERDGVNMHALLPDFQPYNRKAKDFEALGYGNVVGILLIYKPSRNSREQTFHRRQNDSIGKDMPASFGLRVFRLPEWYPHDEVHYTYLSDSRLYYVECSSPNKVHFPSCRGTAFLGDGFLIDYHYSRDHLKDWQRIDKGVRDLVRGFQVADNPFRANQE